MQQDQDFSRITMQQQDFSSMPPKGPNIGIGGYQPNGMEMFNSFPEPIRNYDNNYGPSGISGIMAGLEHYKPNYNQPLQQYGQYLEKEYGKPDFPQKRDQFLQEVSQKEQQTFRNNMANSMLGQPIGSYDLMNRPLGQPFNSFSGQLPMFANFGPMGFGNSILQSAGQVSGPQPISEPMQNYNMSRGNPPGSAR